eukprot:gene6349-563_t
MVRRVAELHNKKVYPGEARPTGILAMQPLEADAKRGGRLAGITRRPMLAGGHRTEIALELLAGNRRSRYEEMRVRVRDKGTFGSDVFPDCKPCQGHPQGGGDCSPPPATPPTRRQEAKGTAREEPPERPGPSQTVLGARRRRPGPAGQTTRVAVRGRPGCPGPSQTVQGARSRPRAATPPVLDVMEEVRRLVRMPFEDALKSSKAMQQRLSTP